jgi:hypothetical protein
MKKLLSTCSLTALALLAGFAVALQPATDACAIGDCTRTFSTAQVTGVSTVDCVWAKMDAQTQAEALVGCSNTCFETFVVIDDNNCRRVLASG